MNGWVGDEVEDLVGECFGGVLCDSMVVEWLAAECVMRVRLRVHEHQRESADVRVCSVGCVGLRGGVIVVVGQRSGCIELVVGALRRAQAGFRVYIKQRLVAMG